MARNHVSNGVVVDTSTGRNEPRTGVTSNLFRSSSERILKSLKRVHNSVTGSLSSLLFYNDSASKEGQKGDSNLDKNYGKNNVTSGRPPKPKLRRPHSFAVGDNIHNNFSLPNLKHTPSFVGKRIDLTELMKRKAFLCSSTF